MENVIVAGANNLSGNLSQCKFIVDEITTGRPNLWVYTKMSLAVNNCTGEVFKYNTWSLSEVAVGCGIAVVLMVIVFLISLTLLE